MYFIDEFGQASMNDLISVIVPVYKVEKYLNRCVESIVNQTYKNLEIILVDDGSPDNCPQMCNEWAKKDERIKVIHQSNQGVSVARNAGIDIAKGSLLCFVDSDDYVDVMYVEMLSYPVTKGETDLTLCNWWREKKNERILGQKIDVKCLNGNLQDDFMFYDSLMRSACGKIFITRTIKENKLYFIPKHKFCEDSIFVLNYCKYVDRIKFLGQPLYTYYDADDSATKIVSKEMFENYLFYLKCFSEFKDTKCLRQGNMMLNSYVIGGIAQFGILNENDKYKDFLLKWDCMKKYVTYGESARTFKQNIALLMLSFDIVWPLYFWCKYKSLKR